MNLLRGEKILRNVWPGSLDMLRVCNGSGMKGETLMKF
jgi:hypothetical protein